MRKTINRAPKTPRKIRDIRPKRQLSRNNPKKHQQQQHDPDDDWWYQANSNSGGEGQTHLRGVAAVNRSNRFGRKHADGNVSPNSETSTGSEEEDDARRIGVFAMLKRTYENIRRVPRQKRRKRLLWGVILLTSLRTIYLSDLESYSFSNAESNINKSNSQPSEKSMGNDLSSSIKGFPDDMPPSLFGEAKSEIDFGSSLQETGLRGSSSLGSLANDMGGNTGMKSMSQADSISIFTQQKSRSMSEPDLPGGDDYGDSFGNIGNSIQSNGFNSYTSDMTNSKTSQQLRGMGDQIDLSKSQSWSQNNQQSNQIPLQEVPQLHGYSLGDDQFQDMGRQNLMSNSQSMTGGGLGSVGFEATIKQNTLMGNSQSVGTSQSIAGINPDSHDLENGFTMNKDTSYQDSFKMPSSPQGGFETDSQFSKSQNQGHTFQNGIDTYQSNQQHMAGTAYATGLDCADYGGPYSESEYSELIYWRDIPTDASYTSPYYNPKAQEATSSSFWKTKYLTFEMDDAGWNNMRLGLENVILLAHSMGRTLVMPPRRQIAHGMYDKSGSKVVSFSDFYDIDSISKRQKGLNIITMEQFLAREALNGHLKSKVDEATIYPPKNQIRWDNQRLDPLWKYIRNVTKTFQWNPKQCVLAFPAAGTDEQHLFSMMADVLVGKDGRPFPHYSEYQGRPVDVNAPPIERFREILAGRRKICMYDKKIHDENQVVHFKADQVDGTRLITQFYAFLWFEDWRHDLWSKRFIRDNLRYNNEIMCLAARIISALRKRAKQHSPMNPDGFYDAIHIRRGDFQQQFPMTEMDASEILAGLQESIVPGSTLFIATNERDISFFGPIQEVYDVCFLGDYGNMLSDINPNYFPLVEQIVASRGRIFVGTFFSTFSAYIARLRGYYSVKEMHRGYTTGGLQNTYFLPTQWKKEMRLYQAIHKPLYGRDFPVAWRDIDRLDLPNSNTGTNTLNNFF